MGKIGDDKKNHIIAFSFIYFSLEPFFGWIAFVFIVFLAAMVEVIDFLSKKGEPSFYDFIASIVIPLWYFSLNLF